MPPFDPELHLRLAGERALLRGEDDEEDDDDTRWQQLATRAQALVAVGAIAEADAAAVLRDYGRAAVLRGADPDLASAEPERPVPDAPLERRTMGCRREQARDDAELDVHFATLTEHSTRIAVTWRTESPPGPTAFPPGRWHHHQLAIGAGPMAGATVTDDRGTTATAHFSGGGGDDGWHGRLTTSSPLAVDTAWLDLDGERFELFAPPADLDASVEALPDHDPAHRHLWHLVVAPPDRYWWSSPQPAIDALVEAGALDPDDPVCRAVPATMAAIDQHAAPGPDVPERWRAMLQARQRSSGPEGGVILGVSAPVFDGIALHAAALTSGRRGWTLDVEVVPNAVAADLDTLSARSDRIGWWAADDRGGTYCGRPLEWGAEEGGATARIAFWPPLDPRATRLDLLPTARTHRAVIRVPLHHLGRA